MKEHQFDKKLALLRKYKEEHGNADVPSNYAEDPRLARWVELQVRYLRDVHIRSGLVIAECLI